MSWIVQSKDEAEKAGADLKNDEAMYVITPKAVAELFNDHMADQEPGRDWSCANPPDYWEQLTDEEREEYLDGVWQYIDKRMTNVDEGIRDIFERMKQRSIRIHEAGGAMVQIALALDDQSEKTGQTPLEILDIACVNYRGYNAEFDDERSPHSQFGELLGRAFLGGREYDPGTDEGGKWWYENVVRKFSQRYEFI